MVKLKPYISNKSCKSKYANALSLIKGLITKGYLAEEWMRFVFIYLSK